MYVVNNNPPSSGSPNPKPFSGSGSQGPCNLLDMQGIAPQSQYQPASEEDIVELIRRDNQYVECFVVFLYHQQEEDEKVSNQTIHRNGVGFNAADARLFSPMAERLISGHSLSPDELGACRKPSKKGKPRLAKYRRQLLKAQNERLQ